jgi:hypothetical protein
MALGLVGGRQVLNWNLRDNARPVTLTCIRIDAKTQLWMPVGKAGSLRKSGLALLKAVYERGGPATGHKGNLTHGFLGATASTTIYDL